LDKSVISDIEKRFYVFINPNNFLTHWNLGHGGLFSMPDKSGTGISLQDDPNMDNLQFTINPQFSGFVSPFQLNTVNNYGVEYNFEIYRRTHFPTFPSRLKAVFLLETEEEATKYKVRHLQHVGDRELICVKSVGKYHYSKHDSSWVDFMRLPSSKDKDTISSVCESYWKGDKVEDKNLTDQGKPWSESPIYEILFLGLVNRV
jgi:hypothetical protein